MHHRHLQLTLARASLLLAVVASSGVAAVARAQPMDTPAARADRLFREGKAALEANRFDEACPKLATSQELDPGTGTLLALALCHEGSGATASAWREFTEVVDASQKRPDRAALAKQHLRAIEPHVSKLTLSVSDPGARATVHLRVDGVDFDLAHLDAATPYDPGDHTVEASAPGASPWKTTVRLGKDGDSKVVVVPSLAPIVAAPPIEPPPSPDADRRRVAWIVGGGSVAMLAVGGVFGVLALTSHSAATSLCAGSSCSSSEGVADNDRAKTEAWVSDFGIGIGLAGMGVATYLLLTHGAAPPPTAAGLRLRPAFGPGGASLFGSW